MPEMHHQDDACPDHARDEGGYDIRSFECRKCTYIHIITVATDPMKSQAAGWLNADLSPPK